MIIETRCHSCARLFEIEADDDFIEADTYTIPPTEYASCPHCGREHRSDFEMRIEKEYWK